ncbi:hypothetical protein L7F22_009935 [Adiantum nelumboides]|nr:hypothetical protein [Adiantum nelumboides]
MPNCTVGMPSVHPSISNSTALISRASQPAGAPDATSNHPIGATLLHLPSLSLPIKLKSSAPGEHLRSPVQPLTAADYAVIQTFLGNVFPADGTLPAEDDPLTIPTLVGHSDADATRIAALDTASADDPDAAMIAAHPAEREVVAKIDAAHAATLPNDAVATLALKLDAVATRDAKVLAVGKFWLWVNSHGVGPLQAAPPTLAIPPCNLTRTNSLPLLLQALSSSILQAQSENTHLACHLPARHELLMPAQPLGAATCDEPLLSNHSAPVYKLKQAWPPAAEAANRGASRRGPTQLQCSK